jgi:hypothetical protein
VELRSASWAEGHQQIRKGNKNYENEELGVNAVPLVTFGLRGPQPPLPQLLINHCQGWKLPNWEETENEGAEPNQYFNFRVMDAAGMGCPSWPSRPFQHPQNQAHGYSQCNGLALGVGYATDGPSIVTLSRDHLDQVF